MSDGTSVGKIQMGFEINQKSVDFEIKKVSNYVNSNFKNMFGGITNQTNNFVKDSLSKMTSGFKTFSQSGIKETEKVSKSINKMNSEYEKTEIKIKEVRSELAKLFAEQDSIARGMHDMPAFSGMTKEASMAQMLKSNPRYNELSEQIKKLAAKIEPLIDKNKILAEEIKVTGENAQSTGNKFNLLGRNTNKAGKDAEKARRKFKLFGNEMEKGSSKAGGFAAMINRSFMTILRRLFVYNLIMKGIRGVMSYMGEALNTNKNFVNSLNTIKTNLRVAFQPIYDFILPALNSLMNALATITTYIASFVSALFGKTYQQSYDAAKGLENAKEAMDGYGKTAKKTLKSLAPFDEINILNSGKSDSIGGGSSNFEMNMPDTSKLEEIGKKTEEMARKVKETLLPLEPLFRGIRDAFKGFWDKLKEFNDTYFSVWLEKIGNWMKANPDTLEKLGKGLGTVALGLGAFKALKWLADVTGMSRLIEKLLELTRVTRNVNKGFKDKNVLLGEQTKATEGDTKATWGLAAAAAALLLALKKVVEHLKNNPIKLPKLEFPPIPIPTIPVPDFKPALKPVLAFETDVGKAMEGIKSTLGKTMEDIKKYISSSIGTIEKNLDTHKSNVSTLALGIGTTFALNLSKGFTTAGGFVNKSVEIIQSNLQTFGKNVGVATGEIAKNLAGNLGAGFNVVSTNFATFANSLGQDLATFGNGFLTTSGEIAKGFASNMISSFITVWDNFKSLMSGIGERVKGWFSANKEVIIKTTIAAGVVVGAGALALAAPAVIPYAASALGGLAAIPALAKGGIVDQPTLAMVGERGKEAVMPLENNTGWITDLATQIASIIGGANAGSGDGQPIYLTIKIGEETLLDYLISALNRQSRINGETVIKV